MRGPLESLMRKLGKNGSKSASPIAFRQSLRAMRRVHARCQRDGAQAAGSKFGQLRLNKTFTKPRWMARVDRPACCRYLIG